MQRAPPRDAKALNRVKKRYSTRVRVAGARYCAASFASKIGPLETRTPQASARSARRRTNPFHGPRPNSEKSPPPTNSRFGNTRLVALRPQSFPKPHLTDAASWSPTSKEVPDCFGPPGTGPPAETASSLRAPALLRKPPHCPRLNGCGSLSAFLPFVLAGKCRNPCEVPLLTGYVPSKITRHCKTSQFTFPVHV